MPEPSLLHFIAADVTDLNPAPACVRGPGSGPLQRARAGIDTPDLPGAE